MNKGKINEFFLSLAIRLKISCLLIFSFWRYFVVDPRVRNENGQLWFVRSVTTDATILQTSSNRTTVLLALV
jgi:hypothetical protein